MSATTKRAGIAAGLATITALSGCSSTDPADTLTVVMWGGASQREHVASYVEPWGEANGIQIVQDSPTDYAKLTAQVESGNVTWGVAEVEPHFAENACASGVLTPLSQEVFDAAEQAGVDSQYVSKCAIPNLLYSFTIGYNTDTYSDGHPTTWTEFFDTKSFPGKRGFWTEATGGIFEAALLADGVAPDELYPLDIDRAFRKLDTIKQDIVFYSTGDEQTQLVASGEAPLVQAWNGRIDQAAASGEPVANAWGENLVTYDQVAIPAGYPNTDIAMRWMVDFLGDTKGQALDAERSQFSPVNPNALAEVSDELVQNLSTFPANLEQSATVIDYKYWAEHYSDVTERLNAWMLS